METIESPLDVLSRAATMVQHCNSLHSSDSDSTDQLNTTPNSVDSEFDRTNSPDGDADRLIPSAKELPSTRWRRDRRSTRMPDYRPRETGRALRSHSFNERKSTTMPPLVITQRAVTPHSDGESPERELVAGDERRINGSRAGKESPLDMRVCPRAPSSPLHPPLSSQRSSHPQHSVSMCDPVIDEHFRRSLGDDYIALFGKKADIPTTKAVSKDRGGSSIVFRHDPCKDFLASKEKTEVKAHEMDVDKASESVDDHFAKALGDTWKKIQLKMDKDTESTKADNKIITRRGVVI